MKRGIRLKVLLTGGAGFIGSCIAEQLLIKNNKVVVVDNLSTGKMENLPAEVIFYKLDIRDPKITDVFEKEKPDVVIHAAAQISVSESIKKPINDADQNIMGIINILEECKKHHLQKIVFTSSAAVYGSPLYLPIDEKHPLHPISFYGLSKLCSELYIQLFSKLYGLKYTILRFANVYGMKQSTVGEAGVISIFVNRLLNGKSLIIDGDGNQTRDFIFVEDVTAAVVKALALGDNQIFNISTHSKTSIKELAETITNQFHMNSSIIYQAGRVGDIEDSILNNNKAKVILNWLPQYKLIDGLKKTIDFYR